MRTRCSCGRGPTETKKKMIIVGHFSGIKTLKAYCTSIEEKCGSLRDIYEMERWHWEKKTIQME